MNPENFRTQDKLSRRKLLAYTAATIGLLGAGLAAATLLDETSQDGKAFPDTTAAEATEEFERKKASQRNGESGIYPTGYPTDESSDSQ